VHLVTYLGFLQRTEETLGRSHRLVSDGHAADADVHDVTADFAAQCAAHADTLARVLARCDPATEAEPERLHVVGANSHRPGPIGLLRDLQDLYQLATLVDSTWTLVRQAAQGARDRDLIEVTNRCAA